MRDAVGVDTDVKLAKIFGYRSTGTISQWRTGEVPVEAILKVSEISDKTFDEIKYGKAAYTRPSDKDVEVLIRESLAKYKGKEIELEPDEYILLCTFRDMPEDERKDFLAVAHDLWAKAKGL